MGHMFHKSYTKGVYGMKTGKWAIAAIIVAGFIVTGCSDGNEVTNITDKGAVTSVTLDITYLDMELGEDYTLIATVLPTTATNKTLTWSSNSTVGSEQIKE
jgi:uncharacterized protein YjdB